MGSVAVTVARYEAPPAPRALVLIADESSVTGQAFDEVDARIASAASTTTPLIAGYHGYSGNSFPSTFAASNCQQGYAYGLTYSLLNVKCDWTSLSNGGMDSTITGFVSSIPAGHTVFLLINHEPENDGNPAGPSVWCAGQARAANQIASLNDPRCIMGICLMTFTWDPSSGRTPSDWNPTSAMTSDALARTVFAPDGYTKARNSAGTTIDTMAGQFADAFAAGASWGFTKFGISEHALNNDIGAPASALVDWWTTDHIPYIQSIDGMVWYAFYNHSGPAAGTSPYLDTAGEEAMFGGFCLTQNR